LLAHLTRDELGRGPGGKAAGNEQQDLTGAPRLVEEGGRHDRRLARAGRRNQQGARSVAQGGEEGGKNIVDRKGRAHFNVNAR
jgi:hypothetical protein